MKMNTHGRGSLKRYLNSKGWAGRFRWSVSLCGVIAIYSGLIGCSSCGNPKLMDNALIGQILSKHTTE